MRTAVLKIVQLHVIGIDERTRKSERERESERSGPYRKQPKCVEKPGGGGEKREQLRFTHHLAVIQGSLGLVGALRGAASAFTVPGVQRRLTDLEDRARGPRALFAPIRCRTHSYTSTKPRLLLRGAQPGRAKIFPPRQPPPPAAAPRRGVQRGIQAHLMMPLPSAPAPPHSCKGCSRAWEPSACRGAAE